MLTGIKEGKLNYCFLLNYLCFFFSLFLCIKVGPKNVKTFHLRQMRADAQRT